MRRPRLEGYKAGRRRARAGPAGAAMAALRCLLLLLCGTALGLAAHLDFAEHRSQAAKIKVNPRGNLWATGTGAGRGRHTHGAWDAGCPAQLRPSVSPAGSPLLPSAPRGAERGAGGLAEPCPWWAGDPGQPLPWRGSLPLVRGPASL